MKVSDEEKVRQRALELERLKQSLFDSNKSTDPRLVAAAVQPSVSLMAPVPPAGGTSRGKRGRGEIPG